MLENDFFKPAGLSKDPRCAAWPDVSSAMQPEQAFRVGVELFKAHHEKENPSLNSPGNVSGTLASFARNPQQHLPIAIMNNAFSRQVGREFYQELDKLVQERKRFKPILDLQTKIEKNESNLNNFSGDLLKKTKADIAKDKRELKKLMTPETKQALETNTKAIATHIQNSIPGELKSMIKELYDTHVSKMQPTSGLMSRLFEGIKSVGTAIAGTLSTARDAILAKPASSAASPEKKDVNKKASQDVYNIIAFQMVATSYLNHKGRTVANIQDSQLLQAALKDPSSSATIMPTILEAPQSSTQLDGVKLNAALTSKEAQAAVAAVKTQEKAAATPASSSSAPAAAPPQEEKAAEKAAASPASSSSAPAKPKRQESPEERLKELNTGLTELGLPLSSSNPSKPKRSPPQEKPAAASPQEEKPLLKTPPGLSTPAVKDPAKISSAPPTAILSKGQNTKGILRIKDLVV